mgnify:CR=1 FL=1
MYIPRFLKTTMTRAADQFPAVILTGPRQSGKTTFLQQEFDDATAYASLDDPFTRDFARHDPQGFLAAFGDKTVILDEVQYVPELFPYLKIRIDQDRRRYGKWLLTGSQQFSMMKKLLGVSTQGGEKKQVKIQKIEVDEMLKFNVGSTETSGKVTDVRDVFFYLFLGYYEDPTDKPDLHEYW